MCLQLPGGRLLLRCRYSGPDSLFGLFSFSFFLFFKLGSRKFAFPGSSQAFGVTNCCRQVAAQKEWPQLSPGRGCVLNDRAAQHALPTPLPSVHSASHFLGEKMIQRCVCFCRLFQRRVQLPPIWSRSLHKKGSHIFCPSFIWDKAGMYNSICNHARFPSILCGSWWKGMPFS